MMNYKPFLCIILLTCLSVFYQCGGQQDQVAQKIINVKLLSIDEDLPIETIQSAIQSFENNHQNMMVNVTNTKIDADSSYATIQEYLNNTDVVIFPSVIEDTLALRKNSFYPLETTESSLQSTIVNHYKSDANDKIWAKPLLLDPVIKIIRKEAVHKTGNQFFPRSWNETFLISDLGSSDESFRQPQFKVYDNQMRGISDSIAAYYLSFGLFNDVIIGKGFSKDLTTEQIEMAEYDIFKTIGIYMKDNDNARNISIDYVNSIDEMIQNKGLFTFVRHSIFKQSSEMEQNQFYYGIAPNIHDKKPVLCYSICASVPISSQEPENAKMLIGQIEENMNAAQEKEGYISIHNFENDSLIPENFYLVIRTNANTYHENIIYDVLNNDKSVYEFNKIWLNGFKILN